MDSVSYKTASLSKENVNQDWYIVDAADLILGRLSSEVAKIIRGKHKPSFTPNVNGGDNVIVINADKVRLTGQKFTKKQYISHSGYPGGQKFATPSLLMSKNPTLVVEKAVKGMLPKNKIGSQMFKNLFVYAGTEHPHEAQKPKELKLEL